MNRTLFRVFTITTAVLVGGENLSLAIDPPSETPAAPTPVAKDEIVTQILPIRYGEAAKLSESLRPLLADPARISVNEGTNSLVLTDTQANIRRVSAIIQAIDTSVASISTIKVIPL